ncbi:hypothetical protein [Janibacter melonis]|uniref:hypothetical protein n=1 Tax=Janibacter melonis TaxID=262209 RepID=UPI0020953EA7|nr:hypothetical protein [Janibacter melonis]
MAADRPALVLPVTGIVNTSPDSVGLSLSPVDLEGLLDGVLDVVEAQIERVGLGQE